MFKVGEGEGATAAAAVHVVAAAAVVVGCSITLRKQKFRKAIHFVP